MRQFIAGAVILLAWNIVVFLLYGLDKRSAKRGGRRVSEGTLLLTAALMGGPGAWLGMAVFRHKTRHAKFKIGVPLLMIVNIAAGALIFYNFRMVDVPMPYQKITPEAAKEMMDNGNATILDVRTEAEFAAAHIENALLIPDTDIRERAPGLLPDKKQVILVYCRTGRRSEQAARALMELGYTRVYDFGGIVDWPYGTIIPQPNS